ncbi:hypothetical protein BC830DRAFT_1079758 [Chytriomyces sp. MP71]|nr:hypothetical protein BC830DRAFT_1079758 [Chytriomyces sp. MP71]
MSVVNLATCASISSSLKIKRDGSSCSSMVSASSVVGGSGPRFRPSSMKRLASSAKNTADTSIVATAQNASYSLIAATSASTAQGSASAATATSTACSNPSAQPSSFPLSALVTGLTCPLAERPRSSKASELSLVVPRPCTGAGDDEETGEPRTVSVTLIRRAQSSRCSRSARTLSRACGEGQASDRTVSFGRGVATQESSRSGSWEICSEATENGDASSSAWADCVDEDRLSLTEPDVEYDEASDQAIVSFTVSSGFRITRNDVNDAANALNGMGGICAWEENLDDAMLMRLLSAGPRGGNALGIQGAAYSYDAVETGASVESVAVDANEVMGTRARSSANKRFPEVSRHQILEDSVAPSTQQSMPEQDNEVNEPVGRKNRAEAKSRHPKFRAKALSSESDWHHHIVSDSRNPAGMPFPIYKISADRLDLKREASKRSGSADLISRHNRLSLLALEKSLRPSNLTSCAAPVHQSIYKEHTPPSYMKSFGSSATSSIPSTSASMNQTQRLLDSDVIVCRKYMNRNSEISLQHNSGSIANKLSSIPPHTIAAASYGQFSDDSISDFLKQRRAALQQEVSLKVPPSLARPLTSAGPRKSICKNLPGISGGGASAGNLTDGLTASGGAMYRAEGTCLQSSSRVYEFTGPSTLLRGTSALSLRSSVSASRQERMRSEMKRVY